MPKTRKRHTRHSKRCKINKHRNSKGVCVRVRGTPSSNYVNTPVHLKRSHSRSRSRSLKISTTFKSLLKSIGLK